MKQLNILHVYKTYYPYSFGGVEQLIYQLAEGMFKYNVCSDVLTLSKNSNHSKQIANHTVYYAKLNFEYASTGMSFSAIQQFRQLIKKADIIQYHFPWPFADIMHLTSFTKKPCILTYHADIIKQKHLLKLYSPVMHLFLNKVNKIVCTSPNYLASSEILQKYQHKTEVIPIGISVDISTDKILSQPKALWHHKLIQPFFLFVGVLRYYKGLFVLLEAAKHVNMLIVIAGNGPQEEALKNKAHELQLKNILFVGEVSEQDKYDLIKLCYAFVFPSNIRTEAFGISLLEAAMHGKAMISCEIGAGMSYINIHNETGLNIPPDNVDALVHAMLTLQNNPELTKLFGQAAQKRAQNLFTVEQMCHKYYQLYSTLV
jgi:O-antigen biosynthesis rhamnosyltransferase